MVRCYDVASMVIKQATKEIGDQYLQDDSCSMMYKMGRLEGICNGIDAFFGEESYGVDVDVDLETLEIIIGIDFNQCEFEKQDPMYNIMEIANDIKIMPSNEIANAVHVEMRFPGIW